MLDELLILSPHNFGVALMNYGVLHASWYGVKKFTEVHFNDDRKDAIREHYRHVAERVGQHARRVEDCQHGRCASL